MGHTHCKGSGQLPKAGFGEFDSTHARCHYCQKMVGMWSSNGKMKKHAVPVERGEG